RSCTDVFLRRFAGHGGDVVAGIHCCPSARRIDGYGSYLRSAGSTAVPGTPGRASRPGVQRPLVIPGKAHLIDRLSGLVVRPLALSVSTHCCLRARARLSASGQLRRFFATHTCLQNKEIRYEVETSSIAGGPLKHYVLPTIRHGGDG